MIDDLDLTLQKLLQEKVPLPPGQYDVSFAIPTERWEGGLARTTANLYLYDLHENLDLRDARWVDDVAASGGYTRERRPVRIDAFYAVTAWTSASAPDVIEEHRLLTELLRTLLNYPTLPREVLVGSLAGQEPPLPTLIAQLDGMPRPSAEFWTSLGNRLRPAISVVVTIALQPAAHLDGRRPVPPATSSTVEVGLASATGATYATGVRPAFPGAPAGAVVLRLQTPAEPTARLGQPTFGSAAELPVVDAAKLRSGSLVLIADGDASEIVRLGHVPGPGRVSVPLAVAVRFPHDSGMPLRFAAEPAAWSAMLDRSADAGDTKVKVASVSGLAAGDWILVDEPGGPEAVRIDAIDGAARELELTFELRSGHTRGAFVRRLSVDAGVAATLAEPVAQPASDLAVDHADRFAVGDRMMLDAGPAVEFARVASVGAGVVAVESLVRGTHAVGAPVRVLGGGRRLGELALAAARGAGELSIAAGDPPRAGDVLEVDGAAVVQVVSATPAPGGVVRSPGAAYAIGGRVQDDGEPPAPVGGARVTMRVAGSAGSARDAVADDQGRYRFATAEAGSYSLVAEAPGFTTVTKVVSIPPVARDEYLLTVSR